MGEFETIKTALIDSDLAHSYNGFNFWVTLDSEKFISQLMTFGFRFSTKKCSWYRRFEGGEPYRFEPTEA